MTSLFEPTCFIASSTEGRRVAEVVADVVRPRLLPEAWWDAFSLNNATLQTLFTKIAFHDYAIVVLTPDDMTKMRGRKEQSPRDNVVFELGMFFGQMGLERAFMLADRNTRLPSDLDGITIARHDGTQASIVRESLKILEHIEISEKSAPPLRLPSSALALGYWKNFVKATLARIDELRRTGVAISVTPYGAVAPTFVSLRDQRVSLEVWIPPTLNGLENINLTARIGANKLGVVVIPGDRRDLSMNCLESNLDETITLVDFPKTLTSTAIAVDALFSRRLLDGEQQRTRLERREIRHFMQTLAHDARGPIATERVKIVALPE